MYSEPYNYKINVELVIKIKGADLLEFWKNILQLPVDVL